MKNIWKKLIKKILPVAICSALLLTGCGSSEPSSESSENVSTEVTAEASTDQSTSGAGQPVKEAQTSENSGGEASVRPDYATVVQITINPKVKLYLAADGSVVDVEYLNEDAQNAFSDLAITGTSLEDAVSMIVDTSAEKGYLTEGKNISVDFVESASEETVQMLAENIQEAVRETLAARQLAATFEIEGVNTEDTANAGENANTGAAANAGENANTGAAANAGNTADTGMTEDARTDKELCSACGGTGICPECGGGTLPCKRCGGSLWESCGICGGSGRQTCQGCHGSGVDSTDGSSCRHCGGAGTYTCELCGGSGGKPCSICNGKGVVSDDCILCHGGKSCTVCGGTGVK